MPRAKLPVFVVALLAVALAAFSLAPLGANADSAKSLSSGDAFTCAVTTGGGMKCWGYAELGQLGTGDATGPEICNNQSSSSFACSKTPVDVVGLTSGVKAVAAGTGHACAIMDGGTVKCWGKNKFGELGSGELGPDTCNTAFFDYPCSPSPVEVVGLTDVVQVEAGDNHTCARTSAGAVKCWGQSGWGQLGAAGGDTCDGEECAKAPIDTPFTAGVQDLAAGNLHTCVITDQGAAKCFGRDGQGELGNGTPGPDSCHVGLTLPCSKTPAQVQGLTSGVLDIAAGATHTCALTGSEVKCWGDNLDGQLANDNGSTDCSMPSAECFSATPVTIGGVSGSMIEAGEDYTCVWPNIACWGSNRLGELNGTPGPDTCDSGYKCSLTPVSEAGLAGDIIALAPGGAHTCVLEAGGKIECWGHGFYGQMGNGQNATSNPTPKTPTGFEAVFGTPTAAAHPMGDANCDDAVNETDGRLALGSVAQVGAPPSCIELANVKCDDGLTVLDVLFIFRYAATLEVTLPPMCRAIGT
jgi:alpha-tubulin suppressor-like RCC1 family protein